MKPVIKVGGLIHILLHLEHMDGPTVTNFNSKMWKNAYVFVL